MLHTTGLQKILTEDGSWTWQQCEAGLMYRSIQGALTESRVIFVEQTLASHAVETWSVLELGLGVGTNFIETLRKHTEAGHFLNYVALDHQPVPAECIEGEDIPSLALRSVLQEARENGQSSVYKTPQFRLVLHPNNWRDTLVPPCFFDAVYHDPFSPEVNPNAWTVDCFRWSHKAIKTAGLLTTYCAAGHVRRAMATAGFFVAKTPGVGRKRESTLASPSSDSLTPHRIKYRP